MRIKQMRKIRGSGKEGLKLSLLVGDLISCVENPKESTIKIIKIHEFSKVAGYKTNIQKLIISIY